jgi:hypothetical protein
MRVVKYKHHLVDLLLLVDRELSRTHVDQQEETTAAQMLAGACHGRNSVDLHNGEDLEEIVLGKVLVRVMRVQGPEVVDVEVEDAQDKHQHDSRELGLEANDNHDTSDQSEQASNNSPEAPVATEDKANEKEDEQDTAGKLEVHLLVLLIEGWQASRSELLADPGVGEHHKQTSHDGEIAQKEVEVEDQTVADALQHHDAHETSHGVFRVFPCDDHDGGACHDDDVYDEEEVGNAIPDCTRAFVSTCSTVREGLLEGAYCVGSRGDM